MLSVKLVESEQGKVEQKLTIYNFLERLEELMLPDIKYTIKLQ